MVKRQDDEVVLAAVNARVKRQIFLNNLSGRASSRLLESLLRIFSTS